MNWKTILLGLFLSLTGCFGDFKSESESNSEPTTYKFGQTVYVKAGFYGGFSCLVLREYSKSIFCRLHQVQVEDGDYYSIQEDFRIRENFEKSNVQSKPLKLFEVPK